MGTTGAENNQSKISQSLEIAGTGITIFGDTLLATAGATVLAGYSLTLGPIRQIQLKNSEADYDSAHGRYSDPIRDSIVSWTDKWIEHTVEDISTLKQQLPSRERVFTPTNINRAIVLGAIGVMIITAKVGLTHVGQELSPGINHFKRDLANPTWQKDQYVKFFLSVGGGVFSSILSNRNKVKKASIAEYAGDFAKYFLATDILLTIGHKNLYDLSSLNGAVGGLALIMESFKATRDRTDFKRRRDHALSSVFEVGVDSYTTLQFPPYILVLLAGLGITILREGARDTFTIHKG